MEPSLILHAQNLRQGVSSLENASFIACQQATTSASSEALPVDMPDLSDRPIVSRSVRVVVVKLAIIEVCDPVPRKILLECDFQSEELPESQRQTA